MWLVSGLPNTENSGYLKDSDSYSLNGKEAMYANGILLGHDADVPIFRDACRALLWDQILRTALNKDGTVNVFSRSSVLTKLNRAFGILNSRSSWSRERYTLVYLAIAILGCTARTEVDAPAEFGDLFKSVFVKWTVWTRELLKAGDPTRFYDEKVDDQTTRERDRPQTLPTEDANDHGGETRNDGKTSGNVADGGDEARDHGDSRESDKEPEIRREVEVNSNAQNEDAVADSTKSNLAEDRVEWRIQNTFAWLETREIFLSLLGFRQSLDPGGIGPFQQKSGSADDNLVTKLFQDRIEKARKGNVTTQM